MARMLPPYIDRNCKSSGEKLLFEIFKSNSFFKDYIVLHSLNISQHVKRLYGEIDFLLLIPDGGIFVLEVKSGDVKCQDGNWFYTDRYGNVNSSKVGPFNQARDAMFSIHTAIEKKYGHGHKYSRILTGFLVSFPHINFNKISVEYEDWQILDKNILTDKIEIFFENLIRQSIYKHKDQKWFSVDTSLPSKEDLAEICNYLRGDFERVRTISERLVDFDRQVKLYTDEQFQILDSIQINPRSLVQGCAGTGKTMIAIESAIRSVSEGKYVFLTCFNRLVSQWMCTQIIGWEERLVVSNLHGYLLEISKGFNYEENHLQKQNFYERYLPVLLRDAYRKGIFRKFDKLIIDEGQDLLRKEYVELFDAMLIGGLASGEWEIYGDFERQAIYSQQSKNEMFNLITSYGFYSNFLLRINCRNTRQIGEETSLVSGFEKAPFLLEHLEGIPVDYFFYSDQNNQVEILNKQLDSLLKKDLPLKELVVLSPNSLENSCARLISGFNIRELKNIDYKQKSQNLIGFSSIQGFKGMESSYVLITDIVDLYSEKAKSLLYIGMSRARYGLVLFIAESQRNEFKNILIKKLGHYA